MNKLKRVFNIIVLVGLLLGFVALGPAPAHASQHVFRITVSLDVDGGGADAVYAPYFPNADDGTARTLTYKVTYRGYPSNDPWSEPVGGGVYFANGETSKTWQSEIISYDWIQWRFQFALGAPGERWGDYWSDVKKQGENYFQVTGSYDRVLITNMVTASWTWDAFARRYRYIVGMSMRKLPTGQTYLGTPSDNDCDRQYLTTFGIASSSSSCGAGRQIHSTVFTECCGPDSEVTNLFAPWDDAYVWGELGDLYDGLWVQCWDNQCGYYTLSNSECREAYEHYIDPHVKTWIFYADPCGCQCASPLYEDICYDEYYGGETLQEACGTKCSYDCGKTGACYNSCYEWCIDNKCCGAYP